FEIIQIQLIGQILDSERGRQADAFLLEEVDTGRNVPDHSRFDSATLKIDFVEESRFEAGPDEFRKRSARVYGCRHARIVATSQRSPPTGRLVGVVHLKLALVAFVVIVGETEAGRRQGVNRLAQEKPPADGGYSKGSRVRIADESRQSA